MEKYGCVLSDAIKREISGTDFQCTVEDRLLLDKMFEGINAKLGSDYHYIAEIDNLSMGGCEGIMLEYITKFESEGVRAYILPHIWSEFGKGCSELIYRLYIHFKNSKEYISEPNKPAPAHIYARYDTAFMKLKPKKLKKELFNLITNPRDAFYLPFTTRMLASWKMEQMENVLLSYLHSENIQNETLGIYSNDVFYPSAKFIKRELKFAAIDGLKHYPSIENVELIKKYANDSDKDIKACAEKTLKAYSKVMEIDSL